MTIKILILGTALVLGPALFSGGAYANEPFESPTDEARILSSAKIPISQALIAAEQATEGKATDAGIDDENGVAHYEVIILKDTKRLQVLVDTQTGQVVKIAAVSDEEDDEGDADGKR